MSQITDEDNETKAEDDKIPLCGCFLLLLPVLCLVGMFIWARFFLEFPNPDPQPRFVYVKEYSVDKAKNLIQNHILNRYNITLSADDRVIHAGRASYHMRHLYVLEPGSDFDYEQFRSTILTGGTHKDNKIIRKGYADDDDSILESIVNSSKRMIEKESYPAWWITEVLPDSDYIGIHITFEATAPYKPGSKRIMFFIISEEEGLIYIYWYSRY